MTFYDDDLGLTPMTKRKPWETMGNHGKPAHLPMGCEVSWASSRQIGSSQGGPLTKTGSRTLPQYSQTLFFVGIAILPDIIHTHF